MILAEQTDINSIVATVVAISLAANGFFLRGVARRIDFIDERQRKQGDRITWLEAHAEVFSHKRRDDEATVFHRRDNDKPVQE